MATYTEIYDDIRADTTFIDKFIVAVAVAAQEVFDEATPGAARLAWAQEALGNPIIFRDHAFNYVVAANKSASAAVILAATDALIQTNVNTWRDKIYPQGV